MLGLLLATTLSIQCVHTGVTQTGYLLSCNDAQRSELVIPANEWPGVWHGPELGFTYTLDANTQAPLPSLPTAIDQFLYQERQRTARERQLRELRRWRARG